MARRKKDAEIDLSVAHELTVDLIEAFRCPDGKTQAFLRDLKSPGLRVRATAASDKKSFVFEAKVKHSGKTYRDTIGGVKSWKIDAARARANELRVQIDKGYDPREQERERLEQRARELTDREAAAAAEIERNLTVRDVWPRYMNEGRPIRKAAWKPRYRSDLERAAAAGGEPKKRGKGVTKPGHLAALMGLRLVDINADVIKDWYASESLRGPVQAARAVAMFSGFLRWCAMQQDYRALVDRHAARSDSVSALIPKPKKRTDALALSQLQPWFAGTEKLRNRTARAYLQSMILTGARREEMATLKWADIDFRWSKLTLADKVGDIRVIPLTPYIAGLLAAQPRATHPDGKSNPYVFSSPMAKSGRISEPRAPLETALKDAGIPHLSIHGLRRTFALMGEEAGAPAGAIAQVMGHRPSAVAEGYKPRSVDQLRGYLELIERFILQAAGIDVKLEVPVIGQLRVVK